RAASDEREHLLENERAARSDAEAASRSKDEFVAMVSHELRTPLNAILGWTHLLATQLGDAEALKRGIEVVTRNARVQEQLISELLDMSGIISGKLRIDVQEVDLVSIIRAALEATRPAAEAKAIAIESTLDPSVALTTGDPARLQQCVWNLLSNAVKFTEQGGRVEARLERVDPYIRIAVSDTGKGIIPDFLPYLFDRFSQADASSAKRCGGLRPGVGAGAK